MTLPRWSPGEMRDSIETEMPVVVDLRADWCSQCRVQEPVVERIVPEFEGRAIIGSVDVGEYPEIPDEFDVAGLPAFLLFKDGKYDSLVKGFKRAPELRSVIGQLITSQPND